MSELATLAAEVRALRAVVVDLAARLPGGPSPSHGSPLVDAATLASELGVSRRFVYEHRSELGVVALGAGPKARLRFDVEAARAALACSAGERSQALNASGDGGSTPAATRGRRRLPNGLPKPGSVLAIRGAADGGPK